jgi:OOP family OmpA-OmpF porin
VRKIVSVIILLLTVSVVSAGEKPHSLQLYPYVGGWIGDEYLGSGFLGGGRLGFAVSEILVLEAGYEYSSNEFRGGPPGKVDASLLYGDLAINFHTARKLTPYFVLGGGDLMLDARKGPDPEDRFAFMWGGGIKYYMTEMLGLRLEARQVIISDSPLNLAITAGVQLRFGGSWPAEVKKEAPRKVEEAAPVSMDSDGDTVVDDTDQCPNTPARVKVDEKGCPVDSDGDTVPDGIDECPNTPKGVKVNTFGCPLDSDGDTVPDGIDQCPGTPPGIKVDERGCYEAAASPDSDGDTVPDNIDKCPHTTPGAKVEENGCPIIAERMLLKGIKFRTGKSIIMPVSYPILDSAIEALKANPEVKVEIQGYTDSRGNLKMNMRLSNARAKAVYNYLIKKGISPKRLTYKGYGPNNPIAPNTTEEGRAQNRRIEFKISE